MGTLALVIGVAVVAALGGYVLGRRSHRRSRKVFMAGVLCGTVAGAVIRRKLTVRVFRQIIGGAVAAGPSRSAWLLDEVRRHRPYNGNSRNDSRPHRRARNLTTVRT